MSKADDELNAELDIGNKCAQGLVEHLNRMRAASLEETIEFEGNSYAVSVKLMPELPPTPAGILMDGVRSINLLAKSDSGDSDCDKLRAIARATEVLLQGKSLTAKNYEVLSPASEEAAERQGQAELCPFCGSPPKIVKYPLEDAHPSNDRMGCITEGCPAFGKYSFRENWNKRVHSGDNSNVVAGEESANAATLITRDE